MAEPALPQIATHGSDGRMKAPAKAHRQHNTGASGRGHCSVGARAVERDRLLHMDVLAGTRGGNDLTLVLAVRGGEHDRVHVRVAENLLIVVDQHDTVVAAELLGCRGRAGMGGDEADVVAARILPLHGMHERSPPAAEADNGCPDHARTVRGFGGMTGSSR